MSGLYLHTPFCSSLCPYCDFAVRKGDEAVRESFVELLIREVGLQDSWQFDTVYFGGGTPSILSTDQLERILTAIRERFEVSEPWISMEVNPEDVSPDRVREWRDLGVSFLSLGIQSFDDDELKFLGRVHRRDRAIASVEVALAGGFEVVSADLIFGLPDQSDASWRQNLRTAATLETQHVSCYQLTVSANTAFGRKREQGRLEELPDERQGSLFAIAHETLAAAGCPAYEVSNFARAREYRSRHNQKYWDHTPYLGLGPSAHSFDGERRWWNSRDFAAYQSAIASGRRAVEGEEVLSSRDLALECLMLRLRTTDGVDLKEFHTRFGIDLVSRNAERLERWIQRGHVTITDQVLAPTTGGLAIADTLAAELRLS